ncbi:unnamed protein product [Nippostrongylus brasiliensis]|uniref:Sister chromatid cohesion protein DCC1 n=1 Tax=Nippostrongylus brasiliensis TaxID=27835 RepID=A0A0N4Y1B4_NIPBR|nr:unnamed protein product [Nippostrongylus brasiliensis]
MELFVKRTPKPKTDSSPTAFATERQARKIVSEGYKVPTLDDVTTLLKVVREEGNVKAEVQRLQFTQKFPLHDYKLVMLPKELLNSINAGDKLVFRGLRQDEVVLCTPSSSYAVKEVESSNSMLIMPTLKVESEVKDEGEKFLSVAPINSIAFQYLELQKIPCVSLYRLRELLHQNTLNWDWMENDSQEETYSADMLLDHVQMSEEELKRALANMPVVEHNGRLRWLSYDMTDKFLNMIVEAFDDINLPSVNITHLTAAALRAFLPENVTDAVIEWFLAKMCTKTESGDYNVNPEPFVRIRAAQLLRAFSKLEMSTFEKLLDEMLPVGIQMELDVMFSMQKLWTIEEISPFLSDICVDERAIDIMLCGILCCMFTYSLDNRVSCF